MPDLTVPVPDSRTAEFYHFFALWLSGSLSLSEGPVTNSSEPSDGGSVPSTGRIPWGDTEADLADAVTLWNQYAKTAKRIFNLLMERPGEWLTGQEIADALDIHKGAYGVAGALGGPARQGKKIRRGLPTSWRESDGGPSTYSISPQRAALFAAAREEVEAAT